MRRNWFTFRFVFIGAMVSVLLLAGLGLGATRLLDTLLVRQTEAKLYAEAVYIRMLFLEELRELSGGAIPEEALTHLPNFEIKGEAEYQPYPPQLDRLRDKVHGPASDGEAASAAPNPLVAEAGRKIEPLLKMVQKHVLSGARVLTSKGVVVASTGEGIGMDLSENMEVAAALEGRNISLLRHRDHVSANLGVFGRKTRTRVFVTLPIITEDKKLAGVVYLSRTAPSPRLALLGENGYLLLALVGAIVVGGGFLLASVAVRPIRELTRSAERISKRGVGEPPEAGVLATKEIRLLTDSFSVMVKRLKDFREDAYHDALDLAHVVKNSLTVIKTAAQSAANPKYCPTEESRKEKLNTIVETVGWLTELSNLIKDLAVEQYDEEGAEIARMDSLPEISETVAHHAGKGNDVTLVKKAQSLPLPMPGAYVKLVVENLINNALKHAKGAPVSVVVGPGPTISVEDEGPGIPKEHGERIWDLGFTTSKSSMGGGLGLYAVKRRIQRYGGKIKLITGDKTTFQVDFSPP
jgi:signal transduction histidine kinase